MDGRKVEVVRSDNRRSGRRAITRHPRTAHMIQMHALSGLYNKTQLPASSPLLSGLLRSVLPILRVRFVEVVADRVDNVDLLRAAREADFCLSDGFHRADQPLTVHLGVVSQVLHLELIVSWTRFRSSPYPSCPSCTRQRRLPGPPRRSARQRGDTHARTWTM